MAMSDAAVKLAEIRTAAGVLGADLAEALARHGAVQCGFCTPGFLMTLVPFLEQNPNPTDAEIRDAISGNLCRCTGYAKIITAVEQASRQMQEVGE